MDLKNKNTKTFTRYVIDCLQRDFCAEDIKKGFTKIEGVHIKGKLFYKKPKDVLFVVPFKKEDILNGFLKNQDDIPDIMYFV